MPAWCEPFGIYDLRHCLCAREAHGVGRNRAPKDDGGGGCFPHPALPETRGDPGEDHGRAAVPDRDGVSAVVMSKPGVRSVNGLMFSADRKLSHQVLVRT
jgi:hypothetical protein